MAGTDPRPQGSSRSAGPPPILPDVLAEDRFLWQFWVNKGMEREPLLRRLGELGPATNWDYIAGNAMYGGFEEEVLVALQSEPSLSSIVAYPIPPTPRVLLEFLDRFARDVRGVSHLVAPDTPEGKLLVLCASPRMTPHEDGEAADLAQRAVNWDALVAAAARSNLTPAVQHNLARLELDARMPGWLAQVLARRARGIASRNRRMGDLLEDLSQLLRAEGIRVLLMKESALALTHFGNGRLRMIGDIDLWLDDPDMDRVVAMLESRGYESAEVLWTKEHFREKHHHVAPLVQADQAVKIEPHRGINLPALPIQAPARMMQAMASRAVRMDAHMWCFTPADILFHLCLDIFGSAFLGKMGQLCDAREVVRQGGVDWPVLEDLGRATGAEAHLVFSLELLAGLDAPVPAEVIERLRAARRPTFDARRLRRMAARNLFGYVRSRARVSRAGEKLKFRALMQPGGTVSRSMFLIKRYLYVGVSDDGTGHLTRRSRPSTGRALARMLTLPWRAMRRWTASRRMP